MNKTLLCTAMVAALTAGAAFAADAPKDAPKKEKCYGIAKAGKNDCKSGAHSCAGHATKDGDKNEWNFVDAGKCAAMGGSTAPADAAPAEKK
jgi:uncharacterized membrane protein